MKIPKNLPETEVILAIATFTLTKISKSYVLFRQSFAIFVIAYIVFFSGCVEQKPTVPMGTPAVTVSITSEQVQNNTPTPSFYGAQQEASTSASIDIESSAEKFTIYVPVLLDENKNVLKMYENPTITGKVGNITTAIVDTNYGKAFMISKSGLGDYLFDWNEVPGNDTGRFVKWLENRGMAQLGDKLDIRKTDDGRTLTVSGGIGYKFWIDEKKVLELINTAVGDTGFFFAKEENGKLNIYSGSIEISMKEKHGVLKEDIQTSYNFFRKFTISMSNYSSPDSFINMTNPYSPPEYSPKIDAWIYSDTDVENLRFYFYVDPFNRIDRIALHMSTDGWTGSTRSPNVHPIKGWNVVNISGGLIAWD